MNLDALARLLMLMGVGFIVMGGLMYIIPRAGFPLGNMPGDIRIQKDGLTCIFPLVSSIILSLVLTLLLNFVIRLLNK